MRDENQQQNPGSTTPRVDTEVVRAWLRRLALTLAVVPVALLAGACLADGAPVLRAVVGGLSALFIVAMLAGALNYAFNQNMPGGTP